MAGSSQGPAAPTPPPGPLAEGDDPDAKPSRSKWIVGGAIAVVVLVILPVAGLLAARAVPDKAAAEPQWAAKRAPYNSADSSCYDVPARPEQAVDTSKPAAVQFEDVTRKAGLCTVQHDYKLPPNCFFNLKTDVPTQNWDEAAALYTKCVEERMTGGVAVGDYNHDGKPDLYLTQLRQGPPGKLFRNNGDGTFTDVTHDAGLDTVEGNGNGALWADVDNDGNLDLVVTAMGAPRFGSSRYFLFMNNGDGTFREEAIPRGVAMDDGKEHRGFSIAAGDFDNDGYLDLFYTEWFKPLDWTSDPRPHQRLFHNKGKAAPGTFEDVTEKAGVVMGRGEVRTQPELERIMKPDTVRSASWGPSFVDVDGDGWVDLVVSSDFGTSQIFWNNHDGTFTDGSRKAQIAKEGNGMGTTFADLAGDGKLYWFVTAIYPRDGKNPYQYYTGNKLYRYNGDRTFTDVTAKAGVIDSAWGWGASFFDMDNDGKIDLVMTNGMFSGMYHGAIGSEEHAATFKSLWHNKGDAQFEEQTKAAGILTTGSGKGLVTLDFDGDGNVDILMMQNGGFPVLYRNKGASNPWVDVRLKGTTSNADGVGAVVKVTDAKGRTTTQIGGVGAHFLAQNDPTRHFGLGDADGPVTVAVTWPVTGKTQVFRDVSPRSTLQVTEGTGGDSG